MNDWLTNQTRSLTKVFRSRERNKYNDEYQALAEAHRDWLTARFTAFSLFPLAYSPIYASSTGGKKDSCSIDSIFAPILFS